MAGNVNNSWAGGRDLAKRRREQLTCRGSEQRAVRTLKSFACLCLDALGSFLINEFARRFCPTPRQGVLRARQKQVRLPGSLLTPLANTRLGDRGVLTPRSNRVNSIPRDT